MADRNVTTSNTLEEFRVEFNELAVDVGETPNSSFTSDKPICPLGVAILYFSYLFFNFVTSSVNSLTASINTETNLSYLTALIPSFLVATTSGRTFSTS